MPRGSFRRSIARFVWLCAALCGVSGRVAAQAAELSAGIARELNLDAGRIETRLLADRAWEREWLRDFHAMRFGRRLWICPRHESVAEPVA